VYSYGSVGNDNSITTSGITPASANNLFLMIGMTSDLSASTCTFSGYSIVTSNPTWTERLDVYNGSITMGMSCASAIRAAGTATGNYSLTATPNTGNQGELASYLMSFQEEIYVPTATFVPQVISAMFN